VGDSYIPIQDVPGGKVNILGGHGVGHYKQKKLYMYFYPIPNGFRDNTIPLYSTQYRRATRDDLTRVANWIDIDGEIFEIDKLYKLCHLNNKYRY
jgi:hypothetical protein